MTKTATVYAKLFFFIYMAIIFSLCFFNFSFQEGIEIPLYILGIPVDKVVHFLMFVPFPILISLAFCRTGAFLVLLLGALLAIFTEGVQYYLLPYREGDILDFAADMTGIAAGLLCLILFKYCLKAFLK